MNCEQYDNFLNDYLDGTLSSDLEKKHHEHLGQCAYCQTRYQEALELKEALESFPVPEPDKQFEVRMLDVLNKDKQTSSPHWITSLIGGALAASIMMWVFFVPGSLTTETGLEQVRVSLPYQQRKDVQLVFNSPIKVNKAHFTITLPDNVEIVGRPGIRQLSWQGRILSGDNRLTLPLVAKGKVSGELSARLTSGERSKIFVIKLNSKPDTTNNLIHQNNKTV